VTSIPDASGARKARPVLVRRLDADGHPVISLPGRVGWAIQELINAGSGGITTIERPAPRWSDYIFKARRRWGLNIETQDEPHGGPYAGTHARYKLRERLEVVA